MGIAVDRDGKRVNAALLGSIAPSEAVYREGTGCTVGPVGSVQSAANATRPVPESDPEALWPEGDKADSEEEEGEGQEIKFFSDNLSSFIAAAAIREMRLRRTMDNGLLTERVAYLW